MIQESNTIEYRIATPNDETDMYAVIEEVAPEIPVSLDTEANQEIIRDIIRECHASGKSWVAIDANGEVVGCVLARPDIHEPSAISLRYVGVKKASRCQGIFATFIEKLKANDAPLTASVLINNSSAMGYRFLKAGFIKVKSDNKETKFRWGPPRITPVRDA
jgi:N-acetylglutamate synthase-like GNAT family acetyltransferase